MQEQSRNSRETESLGGGLGNPFEQSPGRGGLATVASGPYHERLPVGEATVGEIRARFRDRFDIAPGSQAMLDGNAVGDDVRVQPGQVLMFTNRAGEKGGER